MSFQVGRELLKTYLHNYAAFVALMKQNLTVEFLNSLNQTFINEQLNQIKLQQQRQEFEEQDLSPDGYINSVPAIKSLYYFLYTLIFFIGLIGNICVCAVIIRNKTMQSITNCFIFNLSLIDIVMCALCVPFTPIYLLTLRTWIFEKLLCNLLPYAQGVAVYVSSFTMMSIAIDRFFVIIYPLKARLSHRACIAIIGVIWLSAMVLTFPYAWYMELVPDGEDGGRLLCIEQWPHEESRIAFGISTLILQFVVPILISIFCYARICNKLRQRLKALENFTGENNERNKKTRKTINMLITICFVFVVCWMPLNIFNLTQDLYEPLVDWRYSRAFFLLCHVIAMSSTIYNPFLYVWLNEKFRLEMKRLLPCFSRTSRARKYNRSTARVCDTEANDNGRLNEPNTIEVRQDTKI